MPGTRRSALRTASAGRPPARPRLSEGNRRSDLMFEMDETVDQFQIDGVDLAAVPHTVVVPSSTPMRSGSHWNLYP